MRKKTVLEVLLPNPNPGQHIGALIPPTLPGTLLIFHLFSVKEPRRTSTWLSACSVAALRPLVSHVDENAGTRARCWSPAADGPAREIALESLHGKSARDTEMA